MKPIEMETGKRGLILIIFFLAGISANPQVYYNLIKDNKIEICEEPEKTLSKGYKWEMKLIWVNPGEPRVDTFKYWQKTFFFYPRNRCILRLSMSDFTFNMEGKRKRNERYYFNREEGLIMVKSKVYEQEWKIIKLNKRYMVYEYEGMRFLLETQK